MSIGIFELNDVGVLNTNEGAETLVVLLHAYQKTPRYMQSLVDTIRGAMPNCDILAPRLPMRTTSFADPEEIAARVVKAIDGAATPAHTTIILIGHSMGAVLVRKVWALACGATSDGRLGNPPHPWVSKVKRIIQFAAFNRGWTLSSPLGPFERLRWTLGTVISNFFRYVFRRDSLAFAFRRGSAFLTRTRLQILQASRHSPSEAETYQFLGTGDDFVAPSDHIDYATGASRFHYIEAEGATHAGIVKLTEGDGRTRAAFLAVLMDDKSEIAKYELPVAEAVGMGDESEDDFDTDVPPVANADVTQVVFVIHGIRDRGYWTRRLAREVVREADKRGITCRTVTSTYGYFAMGPFLLPWVRRMKVEWLMDQYVTARALYPNAEISYVGHSNGTYLLTKALELCEAVEVKNVVFAGSVVRTKYDWPSYIGARKVEQILNYVATKDWVVAIFPNGLEKLQAQDLGGAGHYGFTLYGQGNVEFVDGDHGAAITFRYWPQIAEFVLSGLRPQLSKPIPQQPWWSRLLGGVAGLIWVAILAAVAALGVGLVFLIATGGGLLWLALFLLYLYLLWVFLNKF